MKKTLLLFLFASTLFFRANAQCSSAVLTINNQPPGLCQTQLTSTVCNGWLQTVCTNGCINLTAALNPNSLIQGLQWFSTSMNITVQSPTLPSTQVCFGNTPSNGDILYLQIAHDNACQTIVACTFFIVNCTGQAEFFTNISEQCKLFPNPATEKISFELPFNLENSSLAIYNTLGELVYSTSNQFFDANTTIDIGTLNKGAYIIEIKTENIVVRKYFIKS